jgi:hypothetical protein
MVQAVACFKETLHRMVLLQALEPSLKDQKEQLQRIKSIIGCLMRRRGRRLCNARLLVKEVKDGSTYNLIECNETYFDLLVVQTRNFGLKLGIAITNAELDMSADQ